MISFGPSVDDDCDVCVCVAVCTWIYDTVCGSGSLVGIATELRGSNSGGERFYAVQTGSGAHPASCTMGTSSFPGVKYGRGVLLTTHPLLLLRL